MNGGQLAGPQGKTGKRPDGRTENERDSVDVHVLNFKYVPLEFQVLFLNTVGFFWMIYLSWAMNRKTKHEVEA